MSEILDKIKPGTKLIRVLADDAKGICKDGTARMEAREMMQTLAKENNVKALAATLEFTLRDMQNKELDFLSPIADTMTIDYNDKAIFKIKNENGIKAAFIAKGATPQRSYVSERTFTVETENISARPAINLMDLRTGRVNMPDIAREANLQMRLQKLGRIENVLQTAIGSGTYKTPFYGTGTGIDISILDSQIDYFRRLGQVSIIGDIAAVSKLVPFMALGNQYSDAMIDAFNNSGYIGMYRGCPVIVMQNAYENGKTVPILKTNWLYLVPGGLTAETKNLKIVEEGGIQVFEAQDINDLVLEMRIDHWFGAAFVTAHIPNLGAYKIN